MQSLKDNIKQQQYAKRFSDRYAYNYIAQNSSSDQHFDRVALSCWTAQVPAEQLKSLSNANIPASCSTTELNRTSSRASSLSAVGSGSLRSLQSTGDQVLQDKGPEFRTNSDGYLAPARGGSEMNAPAYLEMVDYPTDDVAGSPQSTTGCPGVYNVASGFWSSVVVNIDNQMDTRQQLDNLHG